MNQKNGKTRPQSCSFHLHSQGPFIPGTFIPYIWKGRSWITFLWECKTGFAQIYLCILHWKAHRVNETNDHLQMWIQTDPFTSEGYCKLDSTSMELGGYTSAEFFLFKAQIVKAIVVWGFFPPQRKAYIFNSAFIR